MEKVKSFFTIFHALLYLGDFQRIHLCNYFLALILFLSLPFWFIPFVLIGSIVPKFFSSTSYQGYSWASTEPHSWSVIIALSTDMEVYQNNSQKCFAQSFIVCFWMVHKRTENGDSFSTIAETAEQQVFFSLKTSLQKRDVSFAKGSRVIDTILIWG